MRFAPRATDDACDIVTTAHTQSVESNYVTG